MAGSVHRVPGPLHGRHRLLHARALALHPRARRVVARVAEGPAARGRGTDRMEKRRSAVLLLPGALIAVASAAPACTPELDGTRLESRSYVLAYRAAPEVGKHFSVDIAACAQSGPPPGALTIDAPLREHRHRMNYRR